MFVSSNRGKRSIALDLKQPAALEAVRRLIAGADVLVQNFRPGTMERLGLGEPAMRALNRGLVYVSISGVGESGPYLKKRVYDPVIQSLSGLADVQADQDTGRPAHDPHHRRRQDHRGARGAGGVRGTGGAGADRARASISGSRCSTP